MIKIGFVVISARILDGDAPFDGLARGAIDTRDGFRPLLFTSSGTREAM